MVKHFLSMVQNQHFLPFITNIRWSHAAILHLLKKGRQNDVFVSLILNV